MSVEKFEEVVAEARHDVAELEARDEPNGCGKSAGAWAVGIDRQRNRVADSPIRIGEEHVVFDVAEDSVTKNKVSVWRRQDIKQVDDVGLRVGIDRHPIRGVVQRGVYRRGHHRGGAVDGESDLE